MSVNILAGTITASVPAHGTVMYQAADGTQVDIRTCTGGSNQVWTPTSSRQHPTSNGPSGMKGRFNDDLPLTT